MSIPLKLGSAEGVTVNVSLSSRKCPSSHRCGTSHPPHLYPLDRCALGPAVGCLVRNLNKLLAALDHRDAPSEHHPSVRPVKLLQEDRVGLARVLRFSCTDCRTGRVKWVETEAASGICLALPLHHHGPRLAVGQSDGALQMHTPALQESCRAPKMRISPWHVPPARRWREGEEVQHSAAPITNPDARPCFLAEPAEPSAGPRGTPGARSQRGSRQRGGAGARAAATASAHCCGQPALCPSRLPAGGRFVRLCNVQEGRRRRRRTEF